MDGWPDIEIQTVPANLKVYSKRLSENVLIYFTKELLQTTRIMEKAETLHFGFEHTLDTPAKYKVMDIELRNDHWRNEHSKVLDIENLARTAPVSANNSADFAREGFTVLGGVFQVCWGFIRL